jgi:Nif-specific regulatory protein
MPDNQFTYEQLELLRRITRQLADAVDLHRALRKVPRLLAEICYMEHSVISLMTQDGQEVQARLTTDDIPAAKFDRMRYRAGEGITGKVFQSGQSVFITDPATHPDFLNRSGLREVRDIAKCSFFCVPIRYHDTIIGTLSADKSKDLIDNSANELALMEEVAHSIAPFVQRRRLEDQLDIYQHARQPDGAFANLIGKSTVMEEVQKLVVKVAGTNTTVLITGETGTGKGVLAEVIHQLSPRKDEPFVEVNCGAIPENLIESELFGHEKGAFTGALQRHVGVLERAQNGTVFLDEVGELPLPAQTRLLRVLQKREFERVGGTQTITCQARVIAATNRDLEQSVSSGEFRTDLFYRLNVFPVLMPPLRERGKADIMLLADQFIQRFSSEMGREVNRLDTPAIDMLTAYHWPGNVRELENVVERAVLLADGGVIHGHSLPPSLQMNRYAVQQEDRGKFHTLVENYEVELITEALKDTNGNQTRAAEQLGITKRIIQYKIQKYDIDYERFK